MKHRDFVYVGELLPNINTQEHKDFILHFQTAMIQSLVRRNLLTDTQANRAIEELQRQVNIKTKRRENET